ncbi:vWA domain-containing protein [Chengkuizengella axinellae]|uniref:BatA and WFA domain-containing protein n=1 Tax=Chengkuizengella axinellae TaxID=3064388 RepID=A0ABT9IUU3_9BACL|nr:BatA and WFA domain-containing protein [Chengkuizengella sp. 2205SS18-9]MDP5273124.1 BatA and WFA domain-containing protein [Chengkuizengella sp. 2205SS18-9]
MGFLSFSSLWFLISLPLIVLMYLFKRKYIDTVVSSHLLWNKVLRDIEANRPWQKLQNNLLLFLQLLVASFLVMVLMQPFLWVQGNHSKSHVVMVLDRSGSMQTQVSDEDGNVKTKLELAKEQILKQVNDQPSSQYSIVTIGDQPRVVLSKESDYKTISEVLNDIDVYYGQTAYKESLSLVSSLTRQEEDGEIIIYTDRQWTEDMSDLTFYVPVSVKSLSESKNSNVNIVQFGVEQAEMLSDELTATAVYTLKNQGQSEEEVEVFIYAEHQLQFVESVLLQPGQQQSFLTEDLRIADYYRLELNVDDDLKVDNISYAFSEKNETKTALLITEGNLFLEKALKLGDIKVIKVQIDSDGLMVLPKSDVDFIIVDAIDNVKLNSDEWNDLLFSKPVWYIDSLEGDEVVSLPSSDYKIIGHPVTEFISMQNIHISNAAILSDYDGGKPIVYSGDVPLIIAGTKDGYSQLIFTFNLHQSDLPLRVEFPILIQNAVEWLTNDAFDSIGQAVVGETLELAISPKTSKAQWYKQVNEQREFVTEAEETDQVILNLQTIPSEPGMYEFIEMDDNDNQLTRRYLEVVMDPFESNLDYLPELKLQQVNEIHELEVRKSSNGYDIYSIVPWLILLILIMVLLEWGVYQRGSAI